MKDCIDGMSGLTVAQMYPDSASLFSDHFPGNPIVPAFMQLTLIREAIWKSRGGRADQIRVKSVKFVEALHPDAQFSVQIENQPSGGYSFKLVSGGRVVSFGEVCEG